LARKSAQNLRLYEAQQPPLAYLAYWIPYSVFQGAGLLTRAWVLRIAGSAIASLVIPFGFFAARRILRDPLQAVGVVAVAASMPELAMMVDHGGNEPLAIVLGTACVYGLTLTFDNPRRPLLCALFLGGLLGCALLTKAYLLALIPPIVGVHVVLWWRTPESRRRIAVQLLLTCATAAAIAGWWFGRALLATGTLTGHEVAIAASHSTTPFLRVIEGIQWRRVADFAAFTNIWLGGWSFLVLRAWMYRMVELVMLAACAGLLFRFGKFGFSGVGTGMLAICFTLQFFFWTGMLWFVFTAYLATGDGAEPGYYAYALVVPEVVCLIAGLSALIPAAWKRFIVPGLVVCFSALEVYGTVFCLMPYYGGTTAHVRGTVPAMRLGRFWNGGAGELFRNLAVNKPEFLSAGALLALFVVFLAAVAGIVAVGVLTAREGSGSRPVLISPSENTGTRGFSCVRNFCILTGSTDRVWWGRRFRLPAGTSQILRSEWLRRRMSATLRS
jgi:hypothetical protein